MGDADVAQDPVAAAGPAQGAGRGGRGRDGTHTTVLTSADGLQGPTSIALRGHTVHITSASYLAAKDPNLPLTHLGD
ncbi:hypothetical protein [Streptomyces sp. CG 926]|uniref:hypothetical protein n=1 Tax=Streptomyces sp. CG 926 TaxID=1882405 RepID=UPI0011B65141|nr:hypothetical protein [Streptomyces sp. CG 926]